MEQERLQNKIRSFALRTPEKVAIVYKNQNITYSQLHHTSTNIADALRKKFAVNKYVLVLMDKSPFLIETILAIFKFGGIFTPVDPHLPENRLRKIMSEIQNYCVFTEPRFLKMLNSIMETSGNSIAVFVEGTCQIHSNEFPYLKIHEININVLTNLTEEIDQYNDNCYIYFTSGSTGNPKGVLGRHTSLKHFIDWEIEHFKINENFKVSQLITPTFDPFLRDMFVPLCSGGTLCIPDDQDVILNPQKLIHWIDENNISLVHMVPTLFKMMIGELENPNCFRNLKYILLAGELLKGSDLKKFYQLFGSSIQLVNLYGPTETTLAKAFYLIGENDVNRINIPIGRPIDDTDIFIMDSSMKPCPPGTVGEIYIHTSFMSSGYFNDRELMRSVFLKNPFSDEPDDLIYKTGDLGVVLPDGNIECLGRIDNQIKIRGMRIELGEIETHILQNEGVKEAVVVAKEDESGDKSIYAFLIGDEKLDIPGIRAVLLKELPDYMVPSYFAQIDSLPLLPNGKLDRKALLKYEIEMDSGVEYQAPRNEVEEKLLSLWKEVLHVKRVSINDNFFFIGGNSLKAAKLALKIHREFNIEIHVKGIFSNNTIKDLSTYIENSKKSNYSSISLVEKKEYYPVSSAQKRIFLIQLIENTGLSYNMPEALLIEGSPTKVMFEEAFQHIVDRHEALRTSFEFIDDELVQRIHTVVDFKMDYMEVDNQPRETTDMHVVMSDIIKDFLRPFDLGQAPLFRVRLVKIAEDKYILLRDMHHIISDGISEEILKADFYKLCSGQKLAELKIQYKDFSRWQNDMFKSESVREQEKYWLDVFSGELPVLNLPTDFQRPPKRSFEGESFSMVIKHELSEKLNKVAVENGATLYMLLLASFNVLLSKYSGQEDIIVGSPVAGRSHADLDNVIGVFINTLALRNTPLGNINFIEFLQRVKDNSLKAFENQDYQFENLIEKLNIERDLSRNPLFDVMFIMQNMDFEEISIDSLKVSKCNASANVSKFDLTLTAVERDGCLELIFEYCTALFRKETIERLGRHFINILEQVMKCAGIKLSDIDMLSEEEKNQILYEFNNTYAQYPEDKTIHRIFEEQVKKIPYKTALIFKDKRLTYRELNIKANQLADKLRQKGVKADSVVGLMVPRTFEMFIGIMGVLKSGGAYIPIDPEYPADRVHYMVKNSGCRVILTLRGVCSDAFGVEILYMDDESIYTGNVSNPSSCSNSANLAYLIYTSGSTGKPKGVMLEHRNVSNFIKGMTDQIDFSSDKTILCLTTISFDIFVLETLLPLTKGLSIVIADERQQLDPDLLCDVIINNNVDMLQITPSRMLMLLQSPKVDSCLNKIQELIIGGEAFPESMLQNLKQFDKTKIYNVYGPTETTVWSTMKELTSYGEVNIGNPIANTQIYILDRYNAIQPVGIAGELHIAGDGVARGYHQREDLTSERFVANPFCTSDYIMGEASSPAPRMYRTGDLARWLPNGDIEFLGRMDNQVKLRGYRIELPEIEACLMEYSSIEKCVCVVKDSEYDGRYLAAYYVSEQELSVSEIREHLSKFLPVYMVPQSYIHLKQIPMTPNGKIDRKALPEPERVRPRLENEYIAAQTDTEKKVAMIWESVLKRVSIGIHDNFFDLGGNSLLVVIMHDNLQRNYPGKIGVADVFANPTISKLAQFINRKEPSLCGINITSLKLPQEFFIDDNALNEDIVLKYEIDGNLYESLKLILQKSGVELNCVLLSVYTYLLAEVTGQEKITIQMVIDNKNAVQLDMDLSEATDFNSLFKTVNGKLQPETWGDIYPITTIKRKNMTSENDSAVTAFVFKEGVTLKDFTDCDFLLKVYENNSCIYLAFEYNASKIRSVKAEEFFQWYIKMVDLMVNKIND